MMEREASRSAQHCIQDSCQSAWEEHDQCQAGGLSFLVTALMDRAARAHIVTLREAMGSF